MGSPIFPYWYLVGLKLDFVVFKLNIEIIQISYVFT